MTCVFLFFAVTPLALIPFFPDFWLMEAIYASHAGWLGVALFALIVSIVVERVLYGKEEEKKLPDDSRK
jgi:hypothetical protein